MELDIIRLLLVGFINNCSTNRFYFSDVKIFVFLHFDIVNTLKVMNCEIARQQFLRTVRTNGVGNLFAIPL